MGFFGADDPGLRQATGFVQDSAEISMENRCGQGRAVAVMQAPFSAMLS
jgi:hypothetical protein